MKLRKITEREYNGESLPFAAQLNPELYALIKAHEAALGSDLARALHRGIHTSDGILHMDTAAFLESIRTGSLKVKGVGVKRLAQLRRVLLAQDTDETGADAENG